MYKKNAIYINQEFRITRPQWDEIQDYQDGSPHELGLLLLLMNLLVEHFDVTNQSTETF